jgi:hypothetical protein
MHQSGRLASISVSRSSPHAGSHETCLTASIALSRSPAPSIATNHCEVARKITGLRQRQQCG